MTKNSRMIPPHVLDMDFEELEARVLADVQSPQRREGDSGDTAKLLALTGLGSFSNALRGRSVGPVDIHKLRAAKDNGIEPEDVTPHQRQVAKNKNWLAMYSCGPGTFSDFIDRTSPDDADED